MRYLILLISLVAAVSASASDSGIPNLNGKLPPFYLHCEKNGGHLTIDTISGKISWQSETLGRPRATQYVRVTSEYPSDYLGESPRAVQYLRFETVLNQEPTPPFPGPVQYVRRDILNEFTIDSQTKIGCYVNRNLERDLGITCKLQDVLWKVESIGRRLQSIDLHFPFQGLTQSMPAQTAMIVNNGPSIVTFNPSLDWQLNLKEEAGDYIAADSSCTVFSKD